MKSIEKVEPRQEVEDLKKELAKEKQLNAEIKKRLVEIEYDCEEFNHEYCDPNCNGKRKETIDLYQLISDGLNETLLKQKDTEIEQLKTELEASQILAYNRGRAYLASLKKEQERQKENEQLKQQIEKLKICENCKIYKQNKCNPQKRVINQLVKNCKDWEFSE